MNARSITAVIFGTVAMLLLLFGGYYWLPTSMRNDDQTTPIPTSIYRDSYDKKHSPWIDPDTPLSARTLKTDLEKLPFKNDQDERTLDLVFSDEFETDGRTYHDGRDPRWTALHGDDLTNNPLHHYSHNAAKTTNGVLNITLDIHPKTFHYDEKIVHGVALNGTPTTTRIPAKNVTKEFRSGMVQSWNKFCFTGGIIEISAKLPGDPGTGGLWPAMWMMGNLARATYLDTTDHMWPFSTNVCNEQTRNSQEINACQDNPGYGMQPNRGRGAPEVDFLEVMFMENVFPNPLLSASLQVAPGKPKQRPALGKVPNVTWYKPILKNGGSLNLYYWGTYTYDPNATRAYQTDTVSVNFWLNESFYKEQHTYRIEWEPPVEHMKDSPSALSRGGYIKWFIDGQLICAMFGDDLQIVSETEIPSEPMSILLNQALSKDWGFPDAYFLNCPKKCWSCLDPECACALPPHFCEKNVPAHFEIDYVRVYQERDNPRHTLGCSPPERPTREWIEGHSDRYVHWSSPPGTPPLRPIQRGGGVCDARGLASSLKTTTNNNKTEAPPCGGKKRGTCRGGACLCKAGWTGPNCLASFTHETTNMKGKDVLQYDNFDGNDGGSSSIGSRLASKSQLGEQVSWFVWTMMMLVLVACVAGALYIALVERRNGNEKGYTSIPDATLLNETSLESSDNSP